jgi:hypothetical protein
MGGSGSNALAKASFLFIPPRIFLVQFKGIVF